MKLKKFRKNGKQKGIAIGCVIALLLTIAGINLYKTFALYKEEKTFNVLRGVVPDFSSGDVTLAFTINGEARTGETFPNKADGYEVSKVSCDNNVDASWLDDEWALKINNTNDQSKIKCTIDFIKDPYTETLLAGVDPVLNGDLVAVKIDPDSGVVTKADLTKEWYRYGEKRWANAVILTSEGKSKNFKTGATIDEEYIESYFVWIPKYSYQIQTLEVSSQGQEKAFNIKFGTTNTTDKTSECKTPDAATASGSNGRCAVGDYMTHPAFLAFGGNGLWVGKFETGKSSGSVVIKSNQDSWDAEKVANMFTTAKGYQENLTSHMMKNTEWGAVAYLTQSIYGRCTSDNACEEVTINNNSNDITGFAAINGTTSSEKVESNTDGSKSVNYNNPESVKASTTGNYTGIYDMSGGTSEYVMGVMYGTSSNTKPASGRRIGYASGFNGPYSTAEPSENGYGQSYTDGIDFPDARYYDVYKYGTKNTDRTRRILGDATAETNGWFGDEGTFVNSVAPWFDRGDLYRSGNGSGIFASGYNYGNAYGDVGFRIVLAV